MLPTNIDVESNQNPYYQMEQDTTTIKTIFMQSLTPIFCKIDNTALFYFKMKHISNTDKPIIHNAILLPANICYGIVGNVIAIILDMVLIFLYIIMQPPIEIELTTTV